MTRDLDLDCASPDLVPRILRAAAEEYRDSANELQASWQDREAGADWVKIARILDRAADAIDKVI